MAILKIYNEIAPGGCMWLFGDGAVSFGSVEEFIRAIPEEDDSIDIRLHCPGGSVMEGWAIVDLLRATGKTITATIEGQCASMASVILLAASERRGYEHASLLIHDPYYPEGSIFEAQGIDDLERKAEQLRVDKERILNFYVERTGADRAELEALMAEDRFVDMQRAKELGFIHEIIAPVSASAATRPMTVSTLAEKSQHNNQKQNEMAKETNNEARSDKKSLLAKIVALFEADEPVNYELETESGEKITIEKPEGEDPAVGDRAFPDGEHKMMDGSTIVIEDETIVQIIPAEDGGNEELEAAKAKIAELEATIADLNAKLEASMAQAKTPEEIEILDAVRRAGGMRALAQISSSHQPQARKSDIEPVSERVSKTAQRVEEMKKKFHK